MPRPQRSAPAPPMAPPPSPKGFPGRAAPKPFGTPPRKLSNGVMWTSPGLSYYQVPPDQPSPGRRTRGRFSSRAQRPEAPDGTVDPTRKPSPTNGLAARQPARASPDRGAAAAAASPTGRTRAARRRPPPPPPAAAVAAAAAPAVDHSPAFDHVKPPLAASAVPAGCLVDVPSPWATLREAELAASLQSAQIDLALGTAVDFDAAWAANLDWRTDGSVRSIRALLDVVSTSPIDRRDVVVAMLRRLLELRAEGDRRRGRGRGGAAADGTPQRPRRQLLDNAAGPSPAAPPPSREVLARCHAALSRHVAAFARSGGVARPPGLCGDAATDAQCVREIQSLRAALTGSGGASDIGRAALEAWVNGPHGDGGLQLGVLEADVAFVYAQLGGTAANAAPLVNLARFLRLGPAWLAPSPPSPAALARVRPRPEPRADGTAPPPAAAAAAAAAATASPSKATVLAAAAARRQLAHNLGKPTAFDPSQHEFFNVLANGSRQLRARMGEEAPGEAAPPTQGPRLVALAEPPPMVAPSPLSPAAAPLLRGVVLTDRASPLEESPSPPPPGRQPRPPHLAASPEVHRALGESGEYALSQSGANLDFGDVRISENGSSLTSGAGFTPAALVHLDEIGSGASGTVYSALDARRLALVAVKHLPVHDRDRRKQLLAEVRALHSLAADDGSGGDRRIVAFYGAYWNKRQGSVAIAMEYCPGGSVAELVAVLRANVPRRGLEQSVLGAVARDAAAGLAALHAQGRLHRDLKPSNLLLDVDNRVKLADFGLARVLEAPGRRDRGPPPYTEALDLATTFVGTHTYMAPERLRGQAYGYPSDVWSLGVCVLTAALGGVPAEMSGGAEAAAHGASSSASAAASGEGQYWHLLQMFSASPVKGGVHRRDGPIETMLQSRGCRGLSDTARDFVRRCLAMDPSRRATAAELLGHPLVAAAAPPRRPGAAAYAMTAADPGYGDAVEDLRRICQVAAKFRQHAEPAGEAVEWSADRVANLAKQLGLPAAAVAGELEEQWCALAAGGGRRLVDKVARIGLTADGLEARAAQLEAVLGKATG